jgi:hypothetical protein
MIKVKVNVKVKCTLEKAMKAHRKSPTLSFLLLLLLLLSVGSGG